MKEVQELDIYVHPSSLMHNYWVALGVFLATAGGGVLAVIACWYKKCRQSNGSYAYTALEPGPHVHERLELETKACERAYSICSNHLKSNSRYTLLYQLNDIGSRVGKHWFVVRDASVKTERLLTLVPRGPKCPIPCDPENRSVILDLFLALQHPYIYPILDINFRDFGNNTYIFTTLPLNEKGSLKDFIYKSQWQDNWGQKYFQKGNGLPLSQIQRLGRQILEALLFLREKGFPPCGHFHTGNIVLQNGVARITGLENALFGFKSRIHPVLLPRARSEPEGIDSLCFGHVLFEMCAGYELDTPQPSPGNLLDIHHYPQVVEVLEFIFEHPEMRLPMIEELLLCDLFRNIDLREIRNQAQSTQVFKTNLTPKAMELLNEIKRIEKGKQRLILEDSFEGDWPKDKSTSSGGSEEEVEEGDYDADTNSESESSRKKVNFGRSDKEHRCLSLHANAANRILLSVRRKGLTSSVAYEDICKDRGYLDSCLEQLPPLMSRNGTTGIPNSKKQVDAVCSAFKKGMRCIDLYSDTCLSSSVRQIINENVAGARHTFAFLCDDPLFQSEYLQYAPCYRAVTKDWDFCAKRFLKQVPPQNSTSKQATIETCCAKQTFYRCVYEFGNMRCRSDAASFLRRIAETLLNVHIYRMACFPEESYDLHCASSKCGSSHFLSSDFLIFVSITFAVFYVF